MHILQSRKFWAMMIGVFLAFLLLLFRVLSALSDFDLTDREILNIEFFHGEVALQGSLIVANQTGPIVLFVHGDGPQDRFSASGYLPMMNALLDAGISVFSWDKQGIGESKGNWLDQSMQDRAEETAAAVAALRTVPGIDSRRIGLLGFSQAGWVLPRVPVLRSDLSFLIIIGGAITWRGQNVYYTRQRLLAEGHTLDEIAQIVDAQAVQNELYFRSSSTYEDYVSAEIEFGTAIEDVISRDRFGFIQRNIDADMRPFLNTLALPVLTMSGAQDLNVDADESVQTFIDTLSGQNPLSHVLRVTGATHSLLDARYFNYQLIDQWPCHIYLRFLLSGRKAYATDVAESLERWILDSYW